MKKSRNTIFAASLVIVAEAFAAATAGMHHEEETHEQTAALTADHSTHEPEHPEENEGEHGNHEHTPRRRPPHEEERDTRGSRRTYTQGSDMVIQPPVYM